MDIPTKLILAYITLTAVTELTAYISALTLKTNLLVYHIYNPIQLIILCLYFSRIINHFPKKIIYIVGIISIVASISFYIIFQLYQRTLNTYFLIFESIIVVILSLYYYYSVLNDDTTIIDRIHYTIVAIILVSWSFTFFYWLCGLSIESSFYDAAWWVKYLLITMNLITYTSFGLVFLFHNKLKRIE